MKLEKFRKVRLKKLRILMLVTLVITINSFATTALAEQDEQKEITLQENTSIIIKPEEKESEKSKNTIPAIITPEIQQDEKNIVPILELKGGVKEAEIKEESPFKAWLNGDHATGDWHGLRTKLEEHGITIGISYINHDFMKLRGGLNSKSHLKYMGLVDTNLTVDTQKLKLWPGGKLFIDFQNKHGMGLSNNYVGDIQGIDTYDSRQFAQLSEYWYEQGLFSDRFKVRIGKQDANWEFCAFDTGFNTVHAAFFLIPNIPMPTYPDPALGVMTTVQPVKWFSLKTGIYDGNAKGGTLGFDTAFDGKGGAFIINEARVSHSIKNHPGNYIAGHWIHTENLDSLNASRTYGSNTGWYMAQEQMIFKENKNDAEDQQGLYLLGQFGWAPESRNEINQYYGANLQYRGLIPKRKKDRIGLGTAIAKLSRQLRNVDGRKGTETALEWFYQAHITPWLIIQPDMQYVFNPNGKEKGAFIMGVHTMINF